MSRRSITACTFGNIIEWYEFSLFVYLAPVISQLFFPHQQKVTRLLSTLLIFALGFVVRPLGAVVLGHFGDRVGRAKALKFTILLVSTCSVLMGCLPTYEQAGILAPLLLMVCRLLQGLCIGGEFAGAMIYLSEVASPKRRALFSCLTNNGSNIGVLLAITACTGLSALLAPNHYSHYGWRLLFIFGGVLGLLGLWFRRDLTEAAVFYQLQEKIREKYLPIQFVFNNKLITLLKIILLLFISACGSYALMGFISTYLHSFLNIPLAKAYQLQTIFILLSLLLVPCFALLSDNYGRKYILLFATLGYLIFSLPVFYMLQHTTAWWVLLPLAIFYSAEQAVIPATMVELFPGKGRYTGISVAYNITMALVGGTAPALNTFLIHHFHNNLMIAYYVMFCALVSLGVVWRLSPNYYGTTCDLAELQ